MDDYSRVVWVFLLLDKKEVNKMFFNFFAMFNHQFEKKVKIVRNDNGTEFTSMADYFADNGIIFQTSSVGTPLQNGRV